LNAPAQPLHSAEFALLREALAESATWVWSWDIASDELTEIGGTLEALGYAPGAIGRTQADWDRLIHPEDLARNMELYERHARGQSDFYEQVYRVRDAAGGWRWYEERGRIVERTADGTPLRMVGTQTDVTARLEAERRGRDAERQLAELATQLPGLVFRLRLDAAHQTRVESLAGRLAAWFPRPEAWLDTVETADQARLVETLALSAAQGSEWRCEFRVRSPEGRQRWLLAHARPQRCGDASTVWSGYAEDVSVHRELQRSRQDTAVLAAASRTKGELLGRMSHELRTPLNAMLGFAQLMEIDPFEAPGPVQRQRLAAIRQAGGHLLEMIDSVLDISRIESGALELDPRRLDWRAEVEQALALMQPEAERRGVALALRPGEPLRGVADRDRLRQVLLQVLGNAVKFNREGGQIDVVLAQVDGQVRISVRDTGSGMPAALSAALSDAPRPAGAGTVVPAGAGMGLAIVRSLMLLMGGRLSVRSEPGVGTVVALVLPRKLPRRIGPGDSRSGTMGADSRPAALDSDRSSALLPWLQSIT
jgi:hypothetical protein